MKITIIGKQIIDFTDKNGKVVKGFNIYWNEPIPSSYGVGSRAMKKFLDPKYVNFTYDSVPIGDVDVEVGFNGNVLSITSIK